MGFVRKGRNMSLYRNVAAESFQCLLASRGLLTAIVFVPASVPSGDSHLPLVFYRIQSNIDVTCSVSSLSVSKDKIRVKRTLNVKYV